MVHVGKLGSWSLLVVLSFVLVTAVKAVEGNLSGVIKPPAVNPAVERSSDVTQQAPRTVRDEERQRDPRFYRQALLSRQWGLQRRWAGSRTARPWVASQVRPLRPGPRSRAWGLGR